VRLQTILEGIAAHRADLAVPEGDDVMQAAVALIVHEPAGGSPEILFIERATRDGDPWSGQMALPGGRKEPTDRDLQATAERETLEEVGVALQDLVGRLDDFTGGNQRVPSLIVSPYVYTLPRRPKVTTNHEVSSCVWIPVEWILQPESSVQYSFERAETGQTFPAIQYNGYTVWGLTYRILTNFFEILGQDVHHAAPLAPPGPRG
jgi:8-oxo-dGTP pyrophosphatase MutT (NUDIX family)